MRNVKRAGFSKSDLIKMIYDRLAQYRRTELLEARWTRGSIDRRECHWIELMALMKLDIAIDGPKGYDSKRIRKRIDDTEVEASIVEVEKIKALLEADPQIARLIALGQRMAKKEAKAELWGKKEAAYD